MSPTPKPSLDPCSASRIYTVAGPFIVFFPSTAGYNSIATPPQRSDPPVKLWPDPAYPSHSLAYSTVSLKESMSKIL
jgi:hypothetical protein